MNNGMSVCVRARVRRVCMFAYLCVNVRVHARASVCACVCLCVRVNVSYGL